MYELPPILTGTQTQQLAALRAYLVRMAQELNAAEGAAVSYAAQTPARTTPGKTAAQSAAGNGKGVTASADEVRKNAAALRQLILKTADGLSGDIELSAEGAKSYADAQLSAAEETFLARSEFGTFTENIESQIAASARGIVESYGYTEKIESNQTRLSLLQSYVTDIDGQIRRGLVKDPSTGESVTGIAIAQNLQFTGEVTTGGDGKSYYTLSSGQTFGLYTSTGWQFWINGYRRGWYNSVDGMLHIANVAVENALQIGASWRISVENGLGIKYTGE